MPSSDFHFSFDVGSTRIKIITDIITDLFAKVFRMRRVDGDVSLRGSPRVSSKHVVVNERVSIPTTSFPPVAVHCVSIRKQ